MDVRTWLKTGGRQVLVGAVLVAAAATVAVATSSSEACGCDTAPVPHTGSATSTPGGPSGGGSQSPTAPAATPGATSGATPSATPGAKPSPGSLSQVPVSEVTPEHPIELTETADFGAELTLQISKVESVKGTARGPGEIAGPALRLTLELRNESEDPVSLEAMVVAVESGEDQVPAPSLTGPNSKPFAGKLAPGRSATGVYVYAVPVADRDAVEVTVSSTSDEPVVVFQGAV